MTPFDLILDFLLELTAKFEVSSINRSRDIRGSKNSKSGSHDPHMTLFDQILQSLDISSLFLSVC